MLEHDPHDLPPDVTSEALERAYDSTPLPFFDTDQDDPEADYVALVAMPPATPIEALSAAHVADVAGTFFGVGRCLQTQRGFWNVAALWPTARDARLHAAPTHPIPPGHYPPRGSVGFAANHVWLNLGAGLVRTTDYHRAGKVDVALLSRMLEWCGSEGHVWGEVLNGIDVWPSRLPKPPAPHMWSRAQRAEFLKDEMRDALKHGRTDQATHLKAWRNKVLANLNNNTH